MTQIEKYNQRLKLEGKINNLRLEINSLQKEAKQLPYCPCCPTNSDFCLVDGLRGNSREFNIEAAKKLGIAPENLLAAVDFKYTLTEEELGRIINAINNPYTKEKLT